MEPSSMSPIRCRRERTIVPQHVSAARDAAPEPAAGYHEVWAAAPPGAAAFASAEPRRGTGGTLVVPRHTVSELGARLGSFSLRETMRFGVPAASVAPASLEQALDRSLQQEEPAPP